MSLALLAEFKGIIPPLTHVAHKGAAGRIGVIGGSAEYTGAPYFAAISAMRAGADLSHVFCTESASVVIKSYSPDLIVHPLLHSSSSKESCSSITSWFPRLHSLVIGPGLGREPRILDTVKMVIDVAKDQKKDIIIDADGLFLVTMDPNLIRNYDRVILTPNEMEFTRLYEKVYGSKPDSGPHKTDETMRLASQLNVTILRKGEEDVISDGKEVICCSAEGSPRRCGGQGDLLSGVLGVFVHWTRQAEGRLTGDHTPLLLAAYAGCHLIKNCANAAFSKHKRATLASDMLVELPSQFSSLF